MVRVVFLGVLFVTAAFGWGQDHQRVAASVPVVHRIETGVDGSFCPFGYALWDLSLNSRVSYEFQKTWSVSVVVPYLWRSDPDSRIVGGTWGTGNLGLNWAGGGSDLRWRFGLEGSFPLEATREFERVGSVDLGLQWVRDPVILGVSAGVNVPETGSPLSGQGTAFFQEVVNDNLTWSLILSPRWTWYEGLPLWSVSVAWKVGWYDGPTSVTSGISTGSGAPWSCSASVGRTWELP